MSVTEIRDVRSMRLAVFASRNHAENSSSEVSMVMLSDTTVMVTLLRDMLFKTSAEAEY